MLEVWEARKKILEEVALLGKKEVAIKKKEEVKLLESLGRILAQDIISNIDIPPFCNSAVDGFAVKYEETQGASKEKPVWLRLTGEIPAGKLATHPLFSKEAIKIMTGAPVPEGASAVVMIENTTTIKDKVAVHKEVTLNENIRQKGEDIKKEETVLTPGKRIRPAEIAVLASLGQAKVSVYKRPKVAILSTGDELIELDEDITPGKIRNSNSYSLFSLVAQYGGEPILLGIARDNKDDTEKKIRQGLEIGDILLTSAGVSVGEYDLVKDVFKELGIELSFWQVAMQPGKPLVFAEWNGKLVFGLPGNPVSSIITFEEFVRPALFAMMGSKETGFLEVSALLEEDINKKSGKTHFMRGICWNEDGVFKVKTTGSQASGIQKSMILANCIIVIPKEITMVKKGEFVTIQILNHLPLQVESLATLKTEYSRLY